MGVQEKGRKVRGESERNGQPFPKPIFGGQVVVRFELILITVVLPPSEIAAEAETLTFHWLPYRSICTHAMPWHKQTPLYD